MICSASACGGALAVTHTYAVGTEKFQRAVCARCGAVHSLHTTASLVLARGDGAKAQAQRARESTCEREPKTG